MKRSRSTTPTSDTSPTHARRPRRRKAVSLHQAAWPDMFDNLQAAYAELTNTQLELEQRAAEIQRIRDVFARVIESMSEALFLLDVTGRVSQANPAASALLGCDPADLIGRSLAEIDAMAGVPTTPWQLLARAPTGVLSNLDVEVRAPTGRVLPLSLSCGLVRDHHGKITGVLIVARDISERKQAEELLAQQAQELARSNAELEHFAYVASHDLKEPLRMIASFAELLALEYQDKLGTEAKEYIHYMMDGATRMQDLINDLLSYARVGTSGKPFAPVDSAAVLRVACNNLQAFIAENQATISHEHLPIVMGDEMQLIQLFQNLIGNAIKFRADRPLQVQIGAERQAGQWQFWVRDNGIGIEPEFVERIFVIFQRLHSRNEYPGTGIGLAICKKIVERHGGRIWVEAEVGQGSTFYFLLPADDR